MNFARVLLALAVVAETSAASGSLRAQEPASRMLGMEGLDEFVKEFVKAQEDHLNSGPSAIQDAECKGPELEHLMSFYAHNAVQYTLLFLNEGKEEIENYHELVCDAFGFIQAEITPELKYHFELKIVGGGDNNPAPVLVEDTESGHAYFVYEFEWGSTSEEYVLALPVKTTYTFAKKKNAPRKLGAKGKDKQMAQADEWEVTSTHISLKIFDGLSEERRLQEEDLAATAALAEFESAIHAFTDDEPEIAAAMAEFKRALGAHALPMF
jgi:hypothetical protein